MKVLSRYSILCLVVSLAMLAGCAKDEEKGNDTRGGGFSLGNPDPNPTPAVVSLTGNGATEITVNAGDTITYRWNSVRVNTIASYYNADRPDLCPGGYSPVAHANNFQLPWVSVNANETGTVSATVQECQRGVNYTIRVVAEAQDGSVIQALLIVRVRP